MEIKATLSYFIAHVTHNKDQELVRIIKNKEEKCRRVSLLKCFNEVPDNDFNEFLRKCCDMCEKSCNCTECAVPKEVITPPKLRDIRSADNEEKQTLESCITSLSLDDKDVKLIIENINCIHTLTDLLASGLDESVSMCVNLAFKEVFYVDNRTCISAKSTTNDDSKKDDIDMWRNKKHFKNKSNLTLMMIFSCKNFFNIFILISFSSNQVIFFKPENCFMINFSPK